MFAGPEKVISIENQTCQQSYIIKKEKDKTLFAQTKSFVSTSRQYSFNEEMELIHPIDYACNSTPVKSDSFQNQETNPQPFNFAFTISVKRENDPESSIKNSDDQNKTVKRKVQNYGKLSKKRNRGGGLLPN